MSSLADLPEIVGFFSYSREDDEAFKGTLSALRNGFKDWKRVEDVAELTPPRPEEPPPFRAEAQKRKPKSSLRIPAKPPGIPG
jgi:hypothetical protein